MSGIVGLLNLDDGPIDAGRLESLTSAMQFRGPDARHTWNGGRIGFGQTTLQSVCDSGGEEHLCSLDDCLWIVADTRVDGQAELRDKLRAHGRDCRQSTSDARLILHAYAVWGDDCLEHIIGDFAFAIWDRRRCRLFCARDHLGVKPFFYARAGRSLVFGNTLDCLRAHPAVSGEIDERAIADFLLFGINQDPEASVFAAIRRLPAAHRLICSPGTMHVQRYWSLPPEGRVRYSDRRDYVDDFSARLDTAVADRLRSHRIGVLMSGGLDSTAIAASAKSLLAEQYPRFSLKAYACVYDRLFADDERRFAALAADALHIPIEYLVADEYALFEGWRTRELCPPEPADEPLAAIYLDQMQQMSAHCRVALTGWDGDALLSECPRRFGAVFRAPLHGVRRATDFIQRATKRYWRSRLGPRAATGKGNPGTDEALSAMPAWLDAGLVERLALPARWQAVQRARRACGRRHKGAYRVLGSPLLTNLLESYDPGVTRIPVEVRHPLLDVRVVEFVLSLPLTPWCIDKHLLRVAMRGRLPEAVRLRAKTPLAADPVLELLQRDGAHWVDGFTPAAALARFVRRSALPPIAGGRDSEQVWTDLRPLCLNFWLQRVTEPMKVSASEVLHEVA